MALTNNTNYRKKTITINKKVDNVLQTTGGFPKVHSITEAFGSFPAITDTALSVMNTPDYTARLNAFYLFLETAYDYFDRDQVLNNAFGADAVLCPLDNSVPDPIVVASVHASMTANGTPKANHLSWIIMLTEDVTQDTPYTFEVDLEDAQGNLIRTLTVNGIIPAGDSTHTASNSEKIYIPEADDTDSGELIVYSSTSTVQI